MNCIITAMIAKTEVKFDLETDTTGRVLLSNPPQYVHICPKCNKEYHLDNVYPCLVYEDKTVAHDMLGGFGF